MNREQLNALFAMQAAFPNMSKNVGGDGVMRIEIWLTNEQLDFWAGAQALMAPK